MKTYPLLLLAVLLSLQADAKLPEGVYSMCQEVAGYSGEVLELKDGKFRYWFYSDVGTDKEPAYPLTGTYRISGTTLTLDNDQIYERERSIAVVNGVDVLWRADGLQLWTGEKRIHPYAVMIRMAGMTDGSRVDARPSIKSLYTKELLDREKKEYEERYQDRPEEVRVLLRAQTKKGDANMDSYRAEITRARVQPDPKLLAQLIGLLRHDCSDSIEAGSILTDLFQPGWLIKDPPPFMADAAAKKKALDTLIDALSGAPDRWALEKTIILFLRVTGVTKIDLRIPETGHRILLECLPNDGGRYGCEGPSDDDTYWVKSISKVIPAVQKWMRDQLAK
jgi:hypothetical protein